MAGGEVMTTHKGGRAELPFHDDAALFPLMEEEELRALADDILAHGQRNPARRYKGKIIDGRNRVLACDLAGVEPWIIDWDGPGDPLDYIVSENLYRRHLTTAQKAAIGVDLKEKLAERMRQKQREGGKQGGERAGRGRPLAAAEEPSVPAPGKGNAPAAAAVGADSLGPLSGQAKPRAAKASQEAAAKLGAGKTSVEQAAHIKDAAPELHEAMRQGKLSIAEAQALEHATDSERASVMNETDAQVRRKRIKQIRERLKAEEQARAPQARARRTLKDPSPAVRWANLTAAVAEARAVGAEAIVADMTTEQRAAVTELVHVAILFLQRMSRTARTWSDEAMLAYLRDMQTRHGGELRKEHLLQQHPDGRGGAPSLYAVIQRFGGWKQVCELLNQPYRRGRSRSSGAPAQEVR
jgi:hypothetical protein